MGKLLLGILINTLVCQKWFYVTGNLNSVFGYSKVGNYAIWNETIHKVVLC